MRHMNSTLTLSTAALVILACTARAKAETTCSMDILNGSFEFTATGFLVAPSPFAGPFAAIGIQSFDGKGDTEAASTVSVNGAAERVTLRGVYSVNPDCTGLMTLTWNPGGHFGSLCYAGPGGLFRCRLEDILHVPVKE